MDTDFQGLTPVISSNKHMVQKHASRFGILTILIFLVSCKDKRNSSDSLPINEVDGLSPGIQSIKSETIYDIEWYNVPIGKKRMSQTSERQSEFKNDAIEIGLISKTFKRLNNISDEINCFHVIKDGGEIVGFSFLPPGDTDLDESRRWQISRGMESTREVFNPCGDEGVLATLEPLMVVPRIQILELGDWIPSPKVMSEIKTMAFGHDLRAISVLHGESLIKSSSGIVIPGIKCLIFYASNTIDIGEVMKIFPDLRILNVVVSRKSTIQDILSQKSLESNSNNLKVIMIMKRYWDTSKYDFSDSDEGATLRFDSRKVSSNLEYLVLDGTIMSKNDMMAYDSFAIATNSLRERKGRHDLKVKFFRFGYTSGGATSMDSQEFSLLDRFWRD